MKRLVIILTLAMASHAYAIGPGQASMGHHGGGNNGAMGAAAGAFGGHASGAASSGASAGNSGSSGNGVAYQSSPGDSAIWDCDITHYSLCLGN